MFLHLHFHTHVVIRKLFFTVMDAQLPSALTIETIIFPEEPRNFSRTNASVLQIVIPEEAIQHRFTVEG